MRATPAPELRWAEASVVAAWRISVPICFLSPHPHPDAGPRSTLNTPPCKSPSRKPFSGNLTQKKPSISELLRTRYINSVVGPTGSVGSLGDACDCHRAPGRMHHSEERESQGHRYSLRSCGPQDFQAGNVLILSGSFTQGLAASTIWKFFLISNWNPSFCDVSPFPLPFPPWSCIPAKKES